MQLWLQWNSSITCSQFVFVALGIHHAVRMRHCHLWFTRLYSIFSLYLIKARFSKKKKTLFNMKRGFWYPVQLLSETERDTIPDIYWSLCKVPAVLTRFNGILISSIYFRKIDMFQISWKFFHWKPNCLMRADRWTDVTKLIVAFRHFAKASKI